MNEEVAEAEQVDVAAALRQIIDELCDQSKPGPTYFERRDHLEAIVVGVLAKEHTFLLGPPGTSKSEMVRVLCDRIRRSRYWEALLDRQLPMESLFGPIDLKAFEESGDWHRRVDGYLPTADIAFLDEVGKAGPAVLNPMLTVLNERMYHNNSTPMACPLLSAVGASNEELEEELAALWDRWMLRLVIEPIQEPKNLAALLSTASQANQAEPTTVDLEDVHRATEEVTQVKLPPGVIDTVLQLRNELIEDQIKPSDRRWKKAMRLLQAHAYLYGRDTVEEDDLGILRHALWDVAEQIPTVERRTLRLTSEVTRQAMEFQQQISEIEQTVETYHGQSMEKRASYGGEAKHKLDSIQKNVDQLIEKGHRQGKSTAKLEQVRDQVRRVKTRVFVECLNVPEDRAQRMG